MLDLISSGESIARLIRHGRLELNDWRVFAPEAEAAETQTDDAHSRSTNDEAQSDTETTASAVPADEPGWIVPLALWITYHDTLRQREHPVAVLLSPDSKLQNVVGKDGKIDPTGIAFIAIDFPLYTDGRGYSLAQLLRTRYGWQGELRAIGDVMIDTIHYQARVGFDSFLVKPEHDPVKALAAFETFTVHYQKTYPKPPQLLAA